MQRLNYLDQIQLNFKSRVLVIMPHPDDESVFMSGLISRIISSGIELSMVTMTRGEKSTNRFGLKSNDDLSICRYQELKKSFEILGIKKYSVFSYPDYNLESQNEKITNKLKKIYLNYKPTHVFCLEPDGIYGHPDHIALTKYIKSSLKKGIMLFYATVKPNFIQSKSIKMSKKTNIKPLHPDFIYKLSLKEIYIKFKSLKSHKSQFGAFPKYLKVFGYFLINNIFFYEYFVKEKN